MPLLDLTLITLNRTFAGINCPACCGKLEIAPVRKTVWARMLKRNVARRFAYRCMNCRKTYTLTQTGC